MHKIALGCLFACWIAWMLVFAVKANRSSGRQVDVTDPAARWGLLLQAVGYFFVWHYSPVERPSVLLLVGIALAIFGVITAWVAVSALGKQWRVQAGLYAGHELVRSGPYDVVRHPIYASMLAMFLANALLLSTWQLALPALAIFIAGTEIRVRVEDRLLESRFGRQFREYRASTPAYLPFVR